ncbi:siderophore-interacting protein [Pseudactinotalea terrae]|uniref:siderophore-interacting protein n=1 Tax=Pseudactinotalea terrae TaxID=1743262 RepID=UPI0012E1D97C|nr:siderophore-interacting protein [Pseudactinotalea terrae]
MTQTLTATVQPWRLFRTAVTRVQPLSPSFVRITFAGAELTELGDDRFDQRVKVILPAPDGSLEVGDSDGLSWYQELMGREEIRRNPVRTYTSRYVRADAGEIDVDFVLHGDEGPASRWAGTVAPGDEIILCGPNRAHGGPYGGTGFKPAEGTDRFLLVADETAVPAALAILEGLPRDATGAALLEVPHSTDELLVDAPAGVQVRWLGRDGAGHGTMVEPAVRSLLDRWLGEGANGIDVGDLPIDPDGYLWDVPDQPVRGEFYAWLAGEAGVVTRLRRALVKEHGVDRRSVAFMGYWRTGKAEG